MKDYCFDTSGLSTPLQHIPEDIHANIWRQVRDVMQSGRVAVTIEIYNELAMFSGELGNCIRTYKAQLVLDGPSDDWDWNSYLVNSTTMLTTHRQFISEYNNNQRDTICVNDVSIIALAKTLGVPVVSMEIPVLAPGNLSQKKRRIPDICLAEGVEHLTFNEFLRREGIKG